MLDLIKGLPFAISVNGRSFSIKTDFRNWLRFGQILNNYENITDDEAKEIYDFFPLEKPLEDEINEVIGEMGKFYACRELTPRKSTDTSTDVALSLEFDGSYIFGAFMQTYNINLMTEKLHWHEFNALLRSIPSDTKLSEIMGLRCYQKKSESIEIQQQKAKIAWTLPNIDLSEYSLEEIEQMESQAQEEIKNEFYNCL